MSILQKIKYAYHFVKGKNFLIENDILNALKEFNLATKYNSDDYELYIYKALSEFLMKEFDNAMMTYQYSLNLVEENYKLNIDEKQYLKTYILDDLLQIFYILKKFENISKYISLYKECSFDIKNIQANILENFPKRNY